MSPSRKGPSDTIKAAYIGGIFTLLGVLLGISQGWFSALFTPAQAQVLYQTDFEASLSVPVSGKYSLTTAGGNTYLCLDPAETATAYPNLVIGDETWQNYTVEARTMFPEGDAWGNLLVHVLHDPFTAYEYYFNPEWTSLSKKFSDDLPAPVLYAEKGVRLLDGRWSQQRIEVKDGRLKVWLDGNLILAAEDSEPVESGYIRIGAGLGLMCLDDIRVTSLEK